MPVPRYTLWVAYHIPLMYHISHGHNECINGLSLPATNSKCYKSAEHNCSGQKHQPLVTCCLEIEKGYVEGEGRQRNKEDQQTKNVTLFGTVGSRFARAVPVGIYTVLLASAGPEACPLSR